MGTNVAVLKAASGGPPGTLLVDGIATGGGSTAASFTITLSTTKTNDAIILAIEANGSHPTSISSSNVTWAVAARVGSGTGNDIYEWYGIAASALTSEVIAITMSGSAFCSGTALAINGCDVSSVPGSLFDGNGSLPAIGNSGTPSGISTDSSATLVFGLMRGNGDGSPPAGYTDAASPNRATVFMAFDYQIFSGTQSSIGIADTMTGINGWIGDAVKASGT